ncbi:hypothetical protein CAL7716_106380 (plasmid) [Calothrix sp. PCC 7716]|nr:hypothetical protein CAL7716_106380 [Calothrix sp. PCC 7716]
MEQIKAYDKLIGDIQKDLNQLEIEINAIPEINPLNLLLNLLQQNIFKSSQIPELYSRLDRLKAKTQNGLEYYEIAAMKPSIKTESEAKSNNEQENDKTDNSIKASQNQEVNGNNYFSQLIDLLAEVNLLEKRLRQKDTQKLSFR